MMKLPWTDTNHLDWGWCGMSTPMSLTPLINLPAKNILNVSGPRVPKLPSSLNLDYIKSLLNNQPILMGRNCHRTPSSINLPNKTQEVKDQGRDRKWASNERKLYFGVESCFSACEIALRRDCVNTLAYIWVIIWVSGLNVLSTFLLEMSSLSSERTTC